MHRKRIEGKILWEERVGEIMIIDPYNPPEGVIITPEQLARLEEREYRKANHISDGYDPANFTKENRRRVLADMKAKYGDNPDFLAFYNIVRKRIE